MKRTGTQHSDPVKRQRRGTTPRYDYQRLPMDVKGVIATYLPLPSVIMCLSTNRRWRFNLYPKLLDNGSLVQTTAGYLESTQLNIRWMDKLVAYSNTILHYIYARTGMEDNRVRSTRSEKLKRRALTQLIWAIKNSGYTYDPRDKPDPHLKFSAQCKSIAMLVTKQLRQCILDPENVDSKDFLPYLWRLISSPSFVLERPDWNSLLEDLYIDKYLW